jgi:N-acetylglucosamine kinase-like BadF-type ATPase
VNVSTPQHRSIPHSPTSAERQIVIGVDAGNTKTDAVALLRDGTVLGWGQADTGDIYSACGAPAATQQVGAAIEAALSGRHLNQADVNHVAFRLAGIDWPEDNDYWTKTIVKTWCYRGTFSLLNDGFAGIRLGYLDGCGLSITAGTGAAIAARSPDGNEFGLNMWGQHDLGAKGLGISGYRHVALAELGMASSSILSERYIAFFNVQSVADLVHMFTSRGSHSIKAKLARAASLVTAAATEGDVVAQEIVRDQAEILASYAQAVARRVGYQDSERLPIIIGGSVLRAPNSPLASALTGELLKGLPRAEVRVARLPAVCGAALDALAEARITLSASVVDTLTATLPPATRARPKDIQG